MIDTRNWQLGLAVLGFALLLYLLAPVLTPFALAALVAYLCDPLVDRLQAWRCSRTLAVWVVFLLFTFLLTLVLLLVVPLLERQLLRLINEAPRYLAVAQASVLPWIERHTGLRVEGLDAGQLVALLRDHWQQAGGLAAMVLGTLGKSGMAVLLWVVNLAVLPVLVFYLLRDWDGLVERVHALLPQRVEPVVSRLARESDEVLGAFVRGQLGVMAALAIFYTLGLWLIGIEGALLIGVTAGAASFIPYVGAIVGIGAGVIAALVQHGDVLHGVLVLLVFGTGQLLESFVLTPRLVGGRIGLHPVAVIFAVLAGGQLFGFFGVLLALPVAAVVLVLLRHLHERYIASALYGGPAIAASVPEPPQADDAS